MLEISIREWMMNTPFPGKWKFPSLRHVSLQLAYLSIPADANIDVLFFHDLLTSYSHQLHSIRYPCFGILSVGLPELSFPNLQALATNILNLPDASIFTTSSFPIKHLIHSWDITMLDPLHNTPSLGSDIYPLGMFIHRRLYTSEATKIESTMYDRFVEAIPLFPQLEAIYIPDDLCARRNKLQQTHHTILESFTLLGDLCNSRGIRILDLYGDPYPFTGEYHRNDCSLLTGTRVNLLMTCFPE
jgi:hypothetical protein